ncbi:uncharacterized protein MELLADRAFT_114430 [Melampsora larici-populina 98AG31]|uniref:G domain-containing protein n=1 Tax=Melampsora larici-populina (strain 98AG31 / pathotype 3-4-7) TaxID=747676 RepID=F4SDF2_MELLP|nr:uncharacterized protein MELLADRAFT_114430 [Melampsora larici-populina 98AG31]EGF97325.1 hypothetical protein MELLADRAFT_114430 [Melampsora larici-populina 98AG31]
MVCGMPNIGESSLLNAVGCRKGKVASEGPMPGHTRSIGPLVKISEPCKLLNGKPILLYLLKVFRDGKFGNWTLNAFQKIQTQTAGEGEAEEKTFVHTDLNSRVVVKVSKFLGF